MIGQDGHGDRAAAPDGLPMLSAGRHRDPSRGSCVMEYVSVLAGEPWSDHPRCTDRALADLARRVNDDVRAESMPALAELAPRLVGAVGDRDGTDVVVAALARAGLTHAPQDAVLAGVQRRTRARSAPSGTGAGARLRRGLVRFGRAVSGGGVGDTYFYFRRTLQGRPRAERDAARLAALAAAIEDVRRHVGASEAPEATTRPTAASPTPGAVSPSRSGSSPRS